MRPVSAGWAGRRDAATSVGPIASASERAAQSADEQHSANPPGLFPGAAARAPHVIASWLPLDRRARGSTRAAGTLPSAPRLDLGGAEALRERIVAREAQIGDGYLPPARDAELLAQHVAMRLGGSWGDPEPLANLVVRAAGGDQHDHLTLPLGDRHLPLDHCIRHEGRL